ncbi:MAG: hypothetical protein GWN00_09210, partial [Aliifodinibius sp.]|nr:sulfotransferase [Fodinibius sp.]NIV11341.1 hypothetical protein [Fodinibius sp.]NIW97576.1 hypothetical protein [Phycisphaerae bacterium]NIY24974.1 hypothetical protein [Fodinibius sp.]
EYYLKYKKLMSHWKKLLPGEIFDLQYEKLVMEPKKTIEELLKFCE